MDGQSLVIFYIFLIHLFGRPVTRMSLLALRAFSVDCLKFKLKFGLKSYFFYFSLSFFKTLPSDSLFSTLFHLNIHYLFIFYYFLNSQNTFLSHFPPPSPSVRLFHCISPPFFFSFPFFPTTHVPLLFSFFFLFSFLFFFS